MSTKQNTTAPSSITTKVNYKEFFQSVPEAFIMFGIDDPTFTIIEENEAHAKLAGVKRGNVVGKPLFDVFPDLSEEYVKTGVSRLLESIRKVIHTGQADSLPDLKYDLLDSKGEAAERYWSVTHHPLFDEKGKVMAVYQATEDTTAQTLTEKKLKLTEYQLTQALSNGAIGTYAWDVEKDIVVANENFANMYGVPPEEAEKGVPVERFLSAIHPDDRERVEKSIGASMESHEAFETEYRTIDHNSNVRWLILRGKIGVGDNDKVASFAGIAVDITERKNAEVNLQFLTQASTLFNASLDYRKTLKAIAGMVVPDVADWCAIELLDENGVLQQVTVAHKDPEKVKWAEELRRKQGPPDMTSSRGSAQVVRSGEVAYYPYIDNEVIAAAARDEEERQLIRDLNFSSVIIAPLKVEDRILGIISLVATESRVHYTPADVELAKGLANRAALAVYNAELYQSARHEIEGRRQLQKQLAAVNVTLENKVYKRTKQLEVTNKGLEEEIAKRKQAEKELQEYSKNLARSNQELQDFAYVASHDLQEPLRKIQAFGDLLESEYGKQLGEGGEYLRRMRSAASRMSILITDLLAFSRVTTKARDYVPVDLNKTAAEVKSDLETRINDTDGTVEIGKLPTVVADPTHMRQLLQNLIGNALKFHQPDVPPVVKVHADPVKPSDKEYTIYVEDNGIGFDEKYLDRIFSVFQRLHGKDDYEGTGIGLAVCRKIAERYGGTITATSKRGEGSTFIFKIPIEGKEPANDHS